MQLDFKCMSSCVEVLKPAHHRTHSQVAHQNYSQTSQEASHRNSHGTRRDNASHAQLSNR